MAFRCQRLGQAVQWCQLTGTEFNHPAHQIHTIYLLGDAMFHLQAGVHLEKIECTTGIVINIFHGTGAAVVHLLAEFDRSLLQCLTHVVGEIRCRTLFDHFLIAALSRTVPFTNRHHLALTITKQLHFNMTGVLDKFFEEHTAVAEVVLRQTFYRGIRGSQFIGTVATLHTDTTTTGGTFQHHRITNHVGFFQGFV